MSVAIAACRKPYSPGVVAASVSYLVVEGVINGGTDSTIIMLSRTVKLNEKTTLKPELNAILTVDGDDNSSHALTEAGNGKYVARDLNLDGSHKYRLRIKTSGNRQYLSDYVPVLNSPALDSVTYAIKSDGISINVNTHSDRNIRYYRWDYNETWIHQADFDSHYISNGDTVLRRPAEKDIFVCWRNNFSSTITLGSSAKLSQDIISDLPLTFISRHSDKIRHRYSILVSQYALTEDAYNFWVSLKKNTEQLGSIFDAQPSEINGNIHAQADATEPVIGYISISSPQKKRIFIDVNSLPQWAGPLGDGCVLDTLLYKGHDKYSGTPVNQVDEFINYNKATGQQQIPVEAYSLPGQPILGYTASLPDCVDCTLSG